MIPEAIWTARAEADLVREFATSEDVLEGSGIELVETVDSALRLLRMNPAMAPTYSER